MCPANCHLRTQRPACPLTISNMRTTGSPLPPPSSLGVAIKVISLLYSSSDGQPMYRPDEKLPHSVQVSPRSKNVLRQPLVSFSIFQTM